MSQPQGAGGLISTVDDLAIWHRALRDATARTLQPGAANTPPAHLSQIGGKAGAHWVPGLNAVAMWHNHRRQHRRDHLAARRRHSAHPALDLGQPPRRRRQYRRAGRGQPNGTYGRFGHAPGLQGFYVFNGVDGVGEPVCFYALSDGDLVFANGFQAA